MAGFSLWIIGFRIFRPFLARFTVRVVQVIVRAVKVSKIGFWPKLTFL